MSRMSMGEFVAWRAYDRMVGPIGAERHDRLTALLAAVLANINRDSKGHPEPYTLDDFDLYAERPILTRAQEEAQFQELYSKSGFVVKAQ
jgi:hypothetical protein